MEPVKPHAVCIPLPAQGHINPMLKLAKLLHFKGFHITFVHTEFNYQRLINSRGLDSLRGLVNFQFETIPDGLPSTNPLGTQDLPDLCIALPVQGLRSFRELIIKLNSSSDVPPITCIISDGVMSFTLEIAEEYGIPEMVLFTPSACDENHLNNGYLDTVIDWIPAMKGVRLKDIPTFIRTTNPDDIMFNYNLQSVHNARKAAAVILNTFDDLEQEVLDAIKTEFIKLYTIGPLSVLHRKLCPTNLDSIGSNLWKEDTQCLAWLDKRKSRADLVNGGEEILSKEFMEAISDREQQMNCLYSCTKWSIGMENNSDVKREKVESLVRELMEGVKGQDLRQKAVDWRSAEVATSPEGSSCTNFDSIVKQLKQGMVKV
ncbi:hypothetical protein CRYUN_Cryun04dG0077300 [Craigia yunnanensis]